MDDLESEEGGEDQAVSTAADQQAMGADAQQARQGDQLKRGLGPLEATTLVVGGIIGSGIFMAPSLVAR